METLVEKGDVEVHNVAIFQNGLVGNSVTHGFVDRGTNGFGEVVVVEWRRVRASLDGFLVNDGVQLIGSDAWPDCCCGHVQHLTTQHARFADLLDLVLGVDDNLVSGIIALLLRGEPIVSPLGLFNLVWNVSLWTQRVCRPQVSSVFEFWERIVGFLLVILPVKSLVCLVAVAVAAFVAEWRVDVLFKT